MRFNPLRRVIDDLTVPVPGLVVNFCGYLVVSVLVSIGLFGPEQLLLTGFIITLILALMVCVARWAKRP